VGFRHFFTVFRKKIIISQNRRKFGKNIFPRVKNIQNSYQTGDFFMIFFGFEE
jgi:hypothetical protein